jgi:hypothetical protein
LFHGHDQGADTVDKIEAGIYSLCWQIWFMNLLHTLIYLWLIVQLTFVVSPDGKPIQHPSTTSTSAHGVRFS